MQDSSNTLENAKLPKVFWLTGLSGAGKTTIGKQLVTRLTGLGLRCFLLDGDDLRNGLNSDLGFSVPDRNENLRRAGEIARLLNRAGIIVIATFITPLKAQREMLRTIIGANEFREVFVDAPLEVTEKRDPKGLYAKARRGEILQFTGIHDQYQAPELPDIHLKTTELTPRECCDKIEQMITRSYSKT